MVPRARIAFFFFFFCHFLTSLPAPGHCINKCLGRYTSKKKHKYCTWERIPSPSPPTAPRKPSKYCTWPSPALWGPGPAVSLVEAPGTEVLGSPRAPLPTPIMTGSPGAAREKGPGKGPGPAGPQVLRQECFHEDGRRPVQAGVRPWSDTPGRGLPVGLEEASRLRAGGRASPGPPWTRSHPP